MGTYVVGDIHGCYTEWIKFKTMIEAQDNEAKFILVGDIIDRGKETIEMIRWAMDNIKPDGKYQMVIGNHEDMKIEWWRENQLNTVNADIEYENFPPDYYGFFAYMASLGLSNKDVRKIIAWFNSLPLYIEQNIDTGDRIQKYIISHSYFDSEYINKDGSINIKKLNKNLRGSRRDIIWHRNYFGNNWDAPVILIHGHTPTCMFDLKIRGAAGGKIDFKTKDINVDCGLVYFDYDTNLAAIRLEDLQEFYLEDKEGSGLYANMQSSYKEELKILIKEGKEVEIFEEDSEPVTISADEIPSFIGDESNNTEEDNR